MTDITEEGRDEMMLPIISRERYLCDRLTKRDMHHSEASKSVLANRLSTGNGEDETSNRDCTVIYLSERLGRVGR